MKDTLKSIDESCSRILELFCKQPKDKQEKIIYLLKQASEVMNSKQRKAKR